MKRLIVLAGLLSCFLAANAQTGTITGTVNTADGEPAANANISLEALFKRTVSDKNGKFPLNNLDAGTYELVVTFVGMQRSEEHTSELQSLMRISYAVFCLKKNNKHII